MSRFFLLFLILLSLQTFSQNKAAKKLTALKASGNIDSIYLKTTHYKNSWYKYIGFFAESLSDSVYTYKDTIHEKSGDYEIGMVILDTVYHFLNTRIGHWNFYYQNGKTKAQGKFLSGANILCNTGGPQLNIYSYKAGHWTFWYPNGQVMATGTFLNQKKYFDGTCGGEYRAISKTTRKWKFFDTNGNRIKSPSSELIEIIANTGWSYLNL